MRISKVVFLTFVAMVLMLATLPEFTDARRGGGGGFRGGGRSRGGGSWGRGRSSSTRTVGGPSRSVT